MEKVKPKGGTATEVVSNDITIIKDSRNFHAWLELTQFKRITV